MTAERSTWDIPGVRQLCDVPPAVGADPWRVGSDVEVDSYLRDAVSLIEASLEVRSRCAFDHYGSGYASYVDAWFYRETCDFGMDAAAGYAGLVVLLSRESPHFAMGQGTKTWVAGGTASSYLPSFELVDEFDNVSVEQLGGSVESLLMGLGMIRLRARDLEAFLPTDAAVPTILSDPPFRLFDAVFYWED